MDGRGGCDDGLRWSTQLKTDRWLDPVCRKEPQGRVGEKLLSLNVAMCWLRVVDQVRGPSWIVWYWCCLVAGVGVGIATFQASHDDRWEWM